MRAPCADAEVAVQTVDANLVDVETNADVLVHVHGAVVSLMRKEP